MAFIDFENPKNGESYGPGVYDINMEYILKDISRYVISTLRAFVNEDANMVPLERSLRGSLEPMTQKMQEYTKKRTIEAIEQTNLGFIVHTFWLGVITAGFTGRGPQRPHGDDV